MKRRIKMLIRLDKDTHPAEKDVARLLNKWYIGLRIYYPILSLRKDREFNDIIDRAVQRHPNDPIGAASQLLRWLESPTRQYSGYSGQDSESKWLWDEANRYYSARAAFEGSTWDPFGKGQGPEHKYYDSISPEEGLKKSVHWLRDRILTRWTIVNMILVIVAAFSSRYLEFSVSAINVPWTVVYLLFTVIVFVML